MVLKTFQNPSSAAHILITSNIRLWFVDPSSLGDQLPSQVEISFSKTLGTFCLALTLLFSSPAPDFTLQKQQLFMNLENNLGRLLLTLDFTQRTKRFPGQEKPEGVFLTAQMMKNRLLMLKGKYWPIKLSTIRFPRIQAGIFHHCTWRCQDVPQRNWLVLKSHHRKRPYTLAGKSEFDLNICQGQGEEI